MQVQKNSGTSAGLTAVEKSLKNTALSKVPPQIKTSVPLAVPRSVSSLIASLNLPKDRLSANLIPFIRFFSLSFKPELMAEIRRQVNMPRHEIIKQAVTESSSGSAADKNRSALLLAAVAAESKGVELSPKGLELFAEAIDPEWKERHDGGQSKDKRNKNQNKQEESEVINGSVLEKKACESEKNNPLLQIMNRLPGKDGGRWVVNQFEFNDGERNFCVAMRILLGPEQMISRSCFMSLDIAETGELSNRSSFVIESAGNKVNKLGLFTHSDLPQKEISLLKQELSKLLEIPLDRIFVKTSNEAFPFEFGFGEENLHSIDGEV